jgi:hypothetical protein
VLGADEGVIELERFFLRQREHSPWPVGKTFEHFLKGTVLTPADGASRLRSAG